MISVLAYRDKISKWMREYFQIDSVIEKVEKFKPKLIILTARDEEYHDPELYLEFYFDFKNAYEINFAEFQNLVESNYFDRVFWNDKKGLSYFKKDIKIVYGRDEAEKLWKENIPAMNYANFNYFLIDIGLKEKLFKLTKYRASKFNITFYSKTIQVSVNPLKFEDYYFNPEVEEYYKGVFVKIHDPTNKAFNIDLFLYYDIDNKSYVFNLDIMNVKDLIRMERFFKIPSEQYESLSNYLLFSIKNFYDLGFKSIYSNLRKIYEKMSENSSKIILEQSKFSGKQLDLFYS